ncbi:MAG: ice-binding family protein [Burkholderiales bacterium]
MNKISRIGSYPGFLTWFMALILSALVAGCGGGGDSSPVAAPAATTKALSAYAFVSLPAAAATIDEAAKTIAVTVPNGKAVTALVATFTTTGTGVMVGTTAQTSAATANDFTNPVAYIVTAEDGSTATYTVTVTVASLDAKATTAFSFAGLTGSAGTIDETAKTIAVTVPSGTDVAALVATFATTGSVVKVAGTDQESGVTANDFTAPVAYTITDANGDAVTYTVTVSVAALSAKAIGSYSFAGFTGAAGTIDETAKTIAVTLPNGSGVTALTAVFTTTGTGVKVGAVAQTSGTTQNNFTAPVAYIVTAADASTATYTVTVTVAANSAKAVSAYSFAGFSDSVGVIDEAAKTIAVSVPPGTGLTALVATFTTTGASVKVGAAVQTSTATANDFSTSPVAYDVTAADGTTVTYNVTVTLGSGPAPVLLGTAKNFVILTKAGITDVPSSAITGNIGTSPISGAAIGVTCAEVTGTIYSVDAAGPACIVTNDTLLTTAVSDLETAYTDAAGRPAGVGPNLDVGAGTVAGQTLVPGTYTWGTNVTVTTDLTLNGGANDVWIFQITGTLDMSPNMKVILTGGAQAKNIFWQVADVVSLGSGSHFEGIILANTKIAMVTSASTNGRLFAKTEVTLEQNAVTQP